jgi:hypothetical protein
VGVNVNDVTVRVIAGLIVTPALAVDVPNAAVMVAAVVVSTGDAPNAKRPVVVPSDTVRYAGRLIAGLLLDNVTST